MIRTVLGDIAKDELGFTLAHEHLIIDLNRVRKDGVSYIEDIEEVIPEIQMAQKQGIEAVHREKLIDF